MAFEKELLRVLIGRVMDLKYSYFTEAVEKQKKASEVCVEGKYYDSKAQNMQAALPMFESLFTQWSRHGDDYRKFNP